MLQRRHKEQKAFDRYIASLVFKLNIALCWADKLCFDIFIKLLLYIYIDISLSSLSLMFVCKPYLTTSNYWKKFLRCRFPHSICYANSRNIIGAFSKLFISFGLLMFLWNMIGCHFTFAQSLWKGDVSQIKIKTNT